jgi:hypothetical protein
MNFDAHSYFEEVCLKNRLSVGGGYRFCRVTGQSHMEEVIQHFRTEKAYFCIDDTENGHLMQTGGGYMERRTYTVFLLKKFPFGDMKAQHAALNECRQLYRQIMKKLIRDRRRLENEMTYLKMDSIPFYEIPGYFISGCTGLYFMVTVDIPVELCYDGTEWSD